MLKGCHYPVEEIKRKIIQLRQSHLADEFNAAEYLAGRVKEQVWFQQDIAIREALRWINMTTRIEAWEEDILIKYVEELEAKLAEKNKAEARS